MRNDGVGEPGRAASASRRSVPVTRADFTGEPDLTDDDRPSWYRGVWRALATATATARSAAGSVSFTPRRVAV